MTKIKTRITGCLYLMKVAIMYLIGRRSLMFLVTVKEPVIFKILEGKDDYAVDVYRLGIHPYIVRRVFYDVGRSIDPIDMIAEKATFEAEAEININKDETK